MKILNRHPLPEEDKKIMKKYLQIMTNYKNKLKELQKANVPELLKDLEEDIHLYLPSECDAIRSKWTRGKKYKRIYGTKTMSKY